VLEPGPDGRAPKCALRIACDGAPATTVDHIAPVARGGQHVGNLQPACGPCNYRKRGTIVAETGPPYQPVDNRLRSAQSPALRLP
jgi:5-methylcytosine-specific restriction endonuclease McrA